MTHIARYHVERLPAAVVKKEQHSSWLIDRDTCAVDLGANDSYERELGATKLPPWRVPRCCDLFSHARSCHVAH
jgi:hypothetical protein